MLAHAAEYRETLAMERLPLEEREARLQVLMEQEWPDEEGNDE